MSPLFKAIFYVIVAFFIWALLPIFVMLLIDFSSKLFKDKEIKMTYIQKVILGLGCDRIDGIVRQKGNYDCGKSVLENVIISFNDTVLNINLPEPTSVKDMVDTILSLGYKVCIYDNSTLDLVKSILEQRCKVLTLFRLLRLIT